MESPRGAKKEQRVKCRANTLRRPRRFRNVDHARGLARLVNSAPRRKETRVVKARSPAINGRRSARLIHRGEKEGKRPEMVMAIGENCLEKYARRRAAKLQERAAICGR